jgi:dCTP deaminase
MILESADIFNRRINVKDLGIVPWEKERLQPASYEIALGSQFRVFDPTVLVIDASNPGEYTKLVNVDDDEQPWYDLGYYLLRPGEFILGSSVETFTFPPDLAGEITGRSSIGRIALQVHVTAGYIDPGFSGTVTLEIANLSPVPIMLRPGLLIAQMKFFKLSRTSQWAYGHPERGSHYQHQNGPTASRLGQKENQRPIEQLQLPGVDWAKWDSGH